MAKHGTFTNWHVYKTREVLKRQFVDILHELCKKVPAPELGRNNYLHFLSLMANKTRDEGLFRMWSHDGRSRLGTKYHCFYASVQRAISLYWEFMDTDGTAIPLELGDLMAKWKTWCNADSLHVVGDIKSNYTLSVEK